MNIYNNQLFGSKITLIGTTHNSTSKEDIVSTLNSIMPSVVLLEYPEGDIPDTVPSIENLGKGDIKGALSYCNNTKTEYKKIDKYISTHNSSKLNEKLSLETQREIANSEGDKTRELVFENSKSFSCQMSSREQNMVKNIINFCGSEYSHVCIIVGSAHVKPLINSIESLNYI